MSLLKIIETENDIFLESIVEEYPEIVTQVTAEHFVLAVHGTCVRFIKKLIENGFDVGFASEPLFITGWDAIDGDFRLVIKMERCALYPFVVHYLLEGDDSIDMLKLVLQLDCFEKQCLDFLVLRKLAYDNGRLDIFDCISNNMDHLTYTKRSLARVSGYIP